MLVCNDLGYIVYVDLSQAIKINRINENQSQK